MAWLRSALFNLVFFGWTALLALLGLPALAGKGGVHALGRFWIGGLFWALRVLVGLVYRVEGREHMRPPPVIYAAKHQSTWDTLVFALLLDRPAYVLKRELTWIPLFGWYLTRGGAVAVDRSAGGAALRRMLRQAGRAVAEGQPLVIYPEGTRTAVGERRPYQPGVAALYTRLGLPVVPVALNSGLFWRRRGFVKRPGTVTLRLLPAIPPGLSRRDFMAALERSIEEASDELARLAAPPVDKAVDNSQTRPQRIAEMD
ncbi:MAG: 1-acyl-sn-glycerol-3-phosphate acyltransferase [Rhodospirillaceae bacterium]|nr:1-acyl-sn-glycerol-3-phosphate acyltransferase [Rhodospirillaceae bacterium]